jgi:hypothetical protein
MDLLYFHSGTKVHSRSIAPASLIFLCGLSPEAFVRNGVVTRVEFDADEAAAVQLCCQQSRARAAERIANDVVGTRIRPDERCKNRAVSASGATYYLNTAIRAHWESAVLVAPDCPLLAGMRSRGGSAETAVSKRRNS